MQANGKTVMIKRKTRKLQDGQPVAQVLPIGITSNNSTRRLPVSSLVSSSQVLPRPVAAPENLASAETVHKTISTVDSQETPGNLASAETVHKTISTVDSQETPVAAPGNLASAETVHKTISTVDSQETPGNLASAETVHKTISSQETPTSESTEEGSTPVETESPLDDDTSTPESSVASIKPPKNPKKIILDEVLAGIPPNTNEYTRAKEKVEYDARPQNQEYDFLYPDLDDPNFSIKIAKRKEFNDTKYDGAIKPIQQQADIMCRAQFELLPHQIFVKNFLSFQTPYNSLLLYHGLGTGKTCSAIGIAEEMRNYMKQVGIKQRIIVVASPNVQSNFKVQLFDERRLREIDGQWSIHSCIGDALIKEVNPTSLKGLPREKVVAQIKGIINQYYVFMGYVELANFINKKTAIPKDTVMSKEDQRKMEIRNIRRFFNDRLIIIDEVHNIRLTEENNDSKTARLLMKLAKYCQNMRLLLLSATPMYNSYKEIVWLVNLMNSNDKRGLITVDEVFDQKTGTFKEAKDGSTEGGRELLHRKLIGYVSYIRGENPYTFPFRIYPDEFAQDRVFQKTVPLLTSLGSIVSSLTGSASASPKKSFKSPTLQMNGKAIEEPIENLPIYATPIGEYQEKAYRLVIEAMKSTNQNALAFEELDKFGFRLLQTPLESLNIVYPSTRLDDQIQRGKLLLDLEPEPVDPGAAAEAEGSEFADQDDSLSESEFDVDVGVDEPVGKRDPMAWMVGKRGLKSVMTHTDDSKKKMPMRYNFAYRPEILEKYGRIFSPEHLPKYSAKIAAICDLIQRSTGIVIIYSQYIDGGLVPMALALEEMGFARFGSADYTRSLLEPSLKPADPLDALTMLNRSKMEDPAKFKQAKYVMITGDKAFSPQNAEEVKYVSSQENKDGSAVKVIMISKAGSEGLDFKNIRQIHMLEPWYNLNRTEQIVGRGVRNLSHCSLPFEQRNVEIYMHATVMKTAVEEEAADVYVYRLAKKKAEQIGQITRLMKETAVDCLLNIGQTNFTVDKLNALAANQNIVLELSTDKKTLKYRVGDKPHTDVCDYMANCAFTCKPTATILPSNIVQDTYTDEYVQSNNTRIMQRIRQLYRDKHFFKRTELINAINIVKQYPVEQIYSALTVFIQNKNEYLTDKYGRRGVLVNRGDVYSFQPIEINDPNLSIYERSVPIDYKRETVSFETPRAFSLPSDAAPAHTQKMSSYADTELNPPASLAREDSGERSPRAERVQKKPVSEIDTRYAKIKEEFQRNYESMVSKKNALKAGDKDWYKHAGKIVDHVQVVYQIGFGEFIDHVIRHMVDMLLPQDKLVLVNHFYTKIRSPEDLDEIDRVVKEYLDTKLITTERQTGILLAMENKWTMYVQDKTPGSPSNGTWVEAEPEDIRSFEQSGKLSAAFRIDLKQSPGSVGFINVFKTGKEMVFRLKDIHQKQNNTGTRLDSLTKGDIMRRLNLILGESRYVNNDPTSDSILQTGFCVMVEIILRHWSSEKKDGHVWFLNPEEAMYTGITKYQAKN